MRIIYDQVKAGKPPDVLALRLVAAELLKAGAELVVLGCTELSVIALDYGLINDPIFVDSLDQLVRATIETAGRNVRAELPVRPEAGEWRI